jgi:shikimate dehydrogenase
MGELGTVSRLWGAVLGNAWTFVSPSVSCNTAPGQVSLQSALADFSLPEKSASARLVGLVGYPVIQSNGWQLHNRLLKYKKHQLKDTQIQPKDFLYVNFPVQNFQDFWVKWKNFVFGLSITLPHKQSVISHLSITSEEIKNSGVCNTLFQAEAGWSGRNTDLLAIEKLLEPYKKQVKVGVLIVGTGATAKSSIVAVKRLGVKNIILTGSNLLRGKKLAQLLSIQFLQENKLESVEVGCIIQTTSVGMFPKIDDLPPGTKLFTKNMVVLDVIYNPVQTKFLQLAQNKKCIIISGREMFLLKATYQFEIFSGVSTNLDEMRSVLNEIQKENNSD